MAVADRGGSRDNNAMIGPFDIAALRTTPRASFVSRGLGVITVILLAVGSLLSLRDAGGPPSTMSVASADVGFAEPKAPRYLSKPIRDIQPIADRVLADNPGTDGQAPSDFGEYVAAEWRILRLIVPKPDREWMKVTLARPKSWIEAAKRDSEGRLWLEFKELGIANWANVLAIEPCPEAAVGQGRLVTGKFEHSSAEVIDLHVAGVSEPIGTTSNHPFWSEDRSDFVQAGRLRLGERLRLRDNSTPAVTASVPRSQSVPVFNLEVDGEHVYYVAASGVLVHNSEDYYPKDGDPWIEDENGRWHDKNGRWAEKYPQDYGFAGDPKAVELGEGTIISRYGSPRGEFAAPTDVPFDARSMPGEEGDWDHNYYRILQPIDGVIEGPASPAYGKPGGGTQWLLPDTIEELLRQGVIEPL
ncbi:MAG: glycohydrolase toxin TNT-related protein [Planctomycetaceae bacterium]|nr:glycohydrolase toxin TNT-related protein [Planctomycetaceae bacterium]